MIVHHLDQAKTVLAVACSRTLSIQLRSGAGAAAALGVGYLHALGEATGRELLIDCDDDASLVMAALRTGCRQLLFDGSDDAFVRLNQMAERQGASLTRPSSRTHPCLSLLPDDGKTVIQARLDTHDGR